MVLAHGVTRPDSFISSDAVSVRRYPLQLLAGEFLITDWIATVGFVDDGGDPFGGREFASASCVSVRRSDATPWAGGCGGLREMRLGLPLWNAGWKSEKSHKNKCYRDLHTFAVPHSCSCAHLSPRSSLQHGRRGPRLHSRVPCQHGRLRPCGSQPLSALDHALALRSSRAIGVSGLQRRGVGQRLRGRARRAAQRDGPDCGHALGRTCLPTRRVLAPSTGFRGGTRQPGDAARALGGRGTSSGGVVQPQPYPSATHRDQGAPRLGLARDVGRRSVDPPLPNAPRKCMRPNRPYAPRGRRSPWRICELREISGSSSDIWLSSR